MKNIYADEFSFAEKPVTEDEHSIAAVIRALFTALKQKDVNAARSLCSSNAEAEIWPTRKKIPIENFMAVLKKVMPKIVTVQLTNTFIRIKSSGKATVTTIILVRYTDRTIGPLHRTLELEKNENRWLITEMGFMC